MEDAVTLVRLYAEYAGNDLSKLGRYEDMIQHVPANPIPVTFLLSWPSSLLNSMVIIHRMCYLKKGTLLCGKLIEIGQ